MKCIRLHNGNNSKLLLFFCGWGNDSNPFGNLGFGEFDVLFFYEYSTRELTFDLTEVCDKYEEVHLVAWSLGVFAANRLIQNIELKSATAINGTLQPISDDYGIPVAIFHNTLQGMNERNRTKFFRRMCMNKEALSFFNEHAPDRDIDGQIAELTFLKEWIDDTEYGAIENIYDKAIVANADAIFPPANMQAAWKMLLPYDSIIHIDAPHFIFYNTETFGSLTAL